MHRVGIIPAAGRAERFGGIMKELMPLYGERAIIDHTIDVMSRTVDQIVIVTSLEKLPALAAHCSHRYGTPISFTLQHPEHGPDIMGAIVAGCNTRADRYFFAMPDTLYNDDAFEHYPDKDFALGVFQTVESTRYGILVRPDGENNFAPTHIANKKPMSEIPTDGPWDAWGVLTWSDKCVELWRDLQPSSYTWAINFAIREFGANTWRIHSYYDFASHNEYLRYFIARKDVE